MNTTSSAPILEVKDLCTYFKTRAGIVKAVDGVNLTVHAGQILGLVGESGSGKSITSFSIMQLIDPPGYIHSGSINFMGTNLLSKSASQIRGIRGNKIAMIFQDPMMTLNPVLRIDTQMIEAIQVHKTVPSHVARKRALEVLKMVGIPAPEQRLYAYPHQLSGGMRQRIAIAIALLNKPALILADEPTTALDVTIQAQILYEVQKLCKSTGTAMIWVTHDLAVVSGLADRIAVMYAGKIVETGDTETIINSPQHPYTQGLINSIPTRETHGQVLEQIPGMTPSLLELPKGCAFQTRCKHAHDKCTTAPPVVNLSNNQQVRCWLVEERNVPV